MKVLVVSDIHGNIEAPSMTRDDGGEGGHVVY